MGNPESIVERADLKQKLAHNLFLRRRCAAHKPRLYLPISAALLVAVRKVVTNLWRPFSECDAHGF